MKLFTTTEIVHLPGFYKGPRIIIKIAGNVITDDIHLLSVSGQGQSNVQMDLTFDNNMIVTAFGEKLTSLTFQGISVPSTCDGAPVVGDLGAFYRKYRAGTNKTNTPVVQVSLQENVFKGILIGMTIQPYKLSEIDVLLYGLTVQGSFQ